jgi:hypothetical protein
MARASETQSSGLDDRLSRLEVQMRKMQHEFDARIEAIEERRADDEAETIAAERIRSGAADRTQDGFETLAELGISTC